MNECQALPGTRLLTEPSLTGFPLQPLSRVGVGYVAGTMVLAQGLDSFLPTQQGVLTPEEQSESEPKT